MAVKQALVSDLSGQQATEEQFAKLIVHEHPQLPHRGRISPEEAAWVREHLHEVQALRAVDGMPLLDPADPRTKERYGL